MTPLAACLIALIIGVAAENTYVAVVPNNVYPGTTISIPITFLVPITSETVTATLKDHKDVIIASTTATTSTQELLLELEVPKTGITWRSYTLTLEASGSVKFRNETRMWGRISTMAIFIQTDKAIYKPGETVNYRVFVANSSLELIRTPLNIEIFDPKGNKIDEKIGEENLLGVVGDLPLSDMPPLGFWRIEVEATEYENSRETLNFDVQEYVLPKFEVTVNLPAYGTESDISLKGSVNAEYTFGKPVLGTAVLTVSKQYGSGFYNARAIRTSFKIDGETSFEIPTLAIQRLSRNLEYDTLRVHCNVTETLTGVTLGGQATIRYYEQRYKMEYYPNMPSNFKPGFNAYDVLLKVTEQDGRPPPEATGKVKVTTTYFTDSPVNGPILNSVNSSNLDVIAPFLLGDTIMMETVEYALSTDGTVRFTLNIPDKTATASIKSEFEGVKIYKDVSRFRSPGETYLQVEAQNSGPLKIGDTLPIRLRSSEGNSDVKYIIQNKGQIVFTSKVSIVSPQNEAMINLYLERDMAPSSKFVAYFVRADGEIVADGINIPIEDIFENKVTVEFDQTEPVIPQSPVILRVTASAHDSLVNVLAVDKSVILLGGDGNDITPDRVKDKLRTFGDYPFITRGWGFIPPWSFSADDASDIFNNARLTVLSDANLYSFNLWSLDQPIVAKDNRMRPVAMEDSVGFAGGAAGNGAVPTVGQIRKDFPETWIWKSSYAVNGEAVFNDVAPDTITDFVANAFALSPTQGLGVAPIKSNLTVFKTFFVNLQLPYSVVRGEVVVIQANVFNYYPIQKDVTVELKPTPEPEFVGITVDADGNELETTETLVQCVTVKSGQAVPVYFSVRPTIVGTMTVKVRVTTRHRNVNVFDEVHRGLPVEAEGQEKSDNYAVLVINKMIPTTVREVIDITYPSGLVPQSERIRVTVFGDIFGPTLDNLDKLIRMPYGCGEQNMLNFAPAVFAANYMIQTNRLQSNNEIEDKLKDILRTGYQRELLYQRNDGSFSAFGNADNEGSLWLTVFVAKSFAQASTLNLVYIDPAVIEKAVRFVLRYQQKDGSFTNTGIVHHKAMQGGTASNLRALTAYVIIALNEVKKAQAITNQQLIQQLDDALQSAGSYLVSQVTVLNTDYERAIGAWALKEINNAEFSTLLQNLLSSPNKTVEGNSWNHDSRALEVEIVGYVLQLYSSLEDDIEGVKFLNWLVKQRSSNGGFISTQDTIVALQALSSFAGLIYTSNVNLEVKIYSIKGTDKTLKGTISLTSESHDVLQYVDIPGDITAVEIEATGTGLAMIDVNVLYNVIEEAEPPSYILTLTSTAASPTEKNKYTLRACASFNIPNSRSNMAILDVGGVSGFEPQKDQVEMSPLMKRLEAVGGRLMVYFDEIPPKEQCVEVPFQRVALVANVKPATIIAYSYYEPKERVMGMYIPTNLQTAGLCATCGADCGCDTAPGTNPGNACEATPIEEILPLQEFEEQLPGGRKGGKRKKSRGSKSGGKRNGFSKGRGRKEKRDRHSYGGPW